MEEIKKLEINTEDVDDVQKDETDEKQTIDKIDVYKLFSDLDVNGVPHMFLQIKERLCNEGFYPNALFELYEYHQHYTPHFDEFTNFMLACGYFSPSELGDPVSKREKKN